MTPAIITTAIPGTHQGIPSGATRVKENTAASTISIVMIGTSAANRTGRRGARSPATRRSDAIRAAIPSDPFNTLAR
jgi:hypothetical protein